MRFLILALVLLPLPSLPAAESPFDNADKGPKPLKATAITASSEHPNYRVANVADGIATDASRSSNLGFRLPIWPASSAVRPNDGSIQFKAGDTVKADYGFGYLGQHAQLEL